MRPVKPWQVKLTKWVCIPERAFYCWAVIAGPLWAQNISVFLLWGAALFFIGVEVLYILYRDEVILYTFGMGEEFEKGSILWNVPWTVCLGVLIWYGWLWTAGIQLMSIGLWKIIYFDLRTNVEAAKELADDMFGEDEMESLRASLEAQSNVKSRKDLH